MGHFSKTKGKLQGSRRKKLSDGPGRPQAQALQDTPSPAPSLGKRPVAAVNLVPIGLRVRVEA